MRTSKLTAKSLNRAIGEAYMLRIVDLRIQPDWAEQVVQWQMQEWQRTRADHFSSGYKSSDIQSKVQRQIQQQLKTQTGFPLTLIAEFNSQPVGMVSLTLLTAKQGNRSLWLSNLFVLPSFRRQTIGQQLLNSAIQETRSAKIDTLYLATFDALDYFLARRWTYSHQTYFEHLEVQIASLDISIGIEI